MWLSMWVSPRWFRFSGYTTPVKLRQEITVFLLRSWSRKGFIYKFGHASDLKTITPLEGQVRKRTKTRSLRRETCWKGLLCQDIVQSNEQMDTWEQSKTCIIHNSNSQCGRRWGSESPAWGEQKKKTLKKGFSSSSFKLNKTPARLARICIELTSCKQMGDDFR